MKYYENVDLNSHLCKINGKIMPYDACSEVPNAYDKKAFRYIGKGKIYSVNGVLQSGIIDCHFWVYRDRK